MEDKRNYHEPCTCNKPGPNPGPNPTPCPVHKQSCKGSKGNCFCLPPKVVPVEVDGCPILFRKVEIPASVGDETTDPPVPGRYRNVLLYYEATGSTYMYSSDGMPTKLPPKGDKGDQGEQGPQGPTGPAGPQGPEGPEGPQGIQGEQGPQGPAGQDGAGISIEASVSTYANLPTNLTPADNGKGYYVEDEGKLYIWNGTSFPADGDGVQIQGPQGPQGIQGIQGQQGPQGTTGPAGADGADGFSPVATVTQTLTGATITITDAQGTTTADIRNGQDGNVPIATTSVPGKVMPDGTTITVDVDGRISSSAAANTIFYMNASESGSTRHIYKNSDMTGLASSKDVFDANDLGQVILRISTSVTPDQYSDCYLQNAYKATGDYQLLFLDEKTYRSFDTTNINDTTFYYGTRVLQSELTAGTNITISGTTISATDTTYSAFTGATSLDAGTSGLVPAPAVGDEVKYLAGDGTWKTISTSSVTTFYNNFDSLTATMYSDSAMTTAVKGEDIESAFNQGKVIICCVSSNGNRYIEATGLLYYSWSASMLIVETALRSDRVLLWFSYADKATTSCDRTSQTLQSSFTIGSNLSWHGNTLNATDTTYSAFTGATSQIAGTAGLVPAPTTSDPDKYLKGDGTWANLPAANNISSTDWNGLWQ